MLTCGAESNLLKLAEIRGVATSEQTERWNQINQEFLRNKAIGGDDTNVGNRIVAQLGDVVENLRTIAEKPRAVVSARTLLDSLSALKSQATAER